MKTNFEKLVKRFEEIQNTPEYELEKLLVDIGEELSKILENSPQSIISDRTKAILKAKVLYLDVYVKEFHRLGYKIDFKLEKIPQ